ncbi:hypothetical protein I588_04428 [Enterococcus pallens ATCC BAA-351]|uniref:O-antigen polymerase n=2 Tax=Enterococcus pallens TaxID=160454 RepID=R2QI98_9ENTE|nr:hypothetical protein UAU_01825 [Enterococcus pallens ATCC BAA-351]EOU14778.1 hypothetical protein I588_04428 [Enterococcus pallens ATCC BAA-351]
MYNFLNRKVTLKSIVAVLILVMFIFYPFLNQYFDEVIAMIATLYLVIQLLFSIKKFDKFDFRIIGLLLAYFVIGFISNIFSSIDRSLFMVLTDYFLFSKVFILLLGSKIFLSSIGYLEVIEILRVPAKLFTVLVAISGIAEQFIDLGMSNGQRYGIKSFAFIYGYGGALGLILFFVFGILLLDKKSTNTFFLSLNILSILLTTKISVIILPVSFIGLYVILTWSQKFKLWQLIPLAIIAYPFADWSIKAYLLNENYSARSVLYKGSFQIFNQFFPLGSGFGTYGGEMAARYYSPIYLKLQFYNYDGLEMLGLKDYNYLNDNYLSMIIAQTGFLGIGVFLSIVLVLIQSANDAKYSFLERVFTISTIIGLFASSVGSSMLKTSPGCLLFIFLGIVLANKKKGIE